MSDGWIARPEEAMGTPIWKAPVPVGPGSPIGVRTGEVAVLMEMGRVVGVLPAGGHVLDPAAHPFLAMTGGAMDAMFVAIEDCGWIRCGGPAGRVADPETGVTVSLSMRGTYAVDLGDPVRIVQDLAGTAGDPGAAVVQWLGGLIARAVSRVVARQVVQGGVPIVRLAEPEMAAAIAEETARTVIGEADGLVEGLRFSQLAIEPIGESLDEWRQARAQRTGGAAAGLPPGARTLAPGDRAEVLWSDGRVHAATIGAVDGDRYQVIWEGGSGTAWVPATHVRYAAEGHGSGAGHGAGWELRSQVMVRARDGRERPATIMLSAGGRYLVSYDDVRGREWVPADRVLRAREASVAGAVGGLAGGLAASLLFGDGAGRAVDSALDFTVPPSDDRGPFREFQRVWAQAEDYRWYGAKIKRKIGNATYLVEWEDEGMPDTHLDPRYLRGS
jgi:hypothetical protein